MVRLEHRRKPLRFSPQREVLAPLMAAGSVAIAAFAARRNYFAQAELNDSALLLGLVAVVSSFAAGTLVGWRGRWTFPLVGICASGTAIYFIHRLVQLKRLPDESGWFQLGAGALIVAGSLVASFAGHRLRVWLESKL